MRGRARSQSLFAVLLVLASARVAEAAPMRRFALLIGDNDGGPGTAPLRYAEADTQKLEVILRELGGYAPDDTTVILGGSADQVLHALSAIEARIADAKRDQQARTTLLVYYSGHGKDGDLRLGRSHLPMGVLRRALSDSGADMKLGIIDSCQSGAITREKGGRRGPSFLVDSDDRDIGRGLILISSSSDNESSQESDELGGSFFTHYLVSGLRGDADESGDRRVTLGEVYAYTYHKTVSVTANTRSGTQHPTYSYDLKGNGDIVLTDLTHGTSGVAFAAPLAGDFLIFDMGRGQVAAEVHKEPGLERRIALAPGEYVVKKRLEDHLRMKRFTLAADRDYAVAESEMERVEFEDDYAKGGLDGWGTHSRPRAALQAIFLYQSFFSDDARKELFPPLALFGAGVDFGPVLGARVGLEALFGGRNQQVLELKGLSLGYDFFEAELAASMIWSAQLGDFAFRAGPRIAGVYFLRTFPGDVVLSKHTQDHFAFSPGASGSVAWFPGEARDFSVSVETRAGYLPFSVDRNRSLIYGELGVMLAYRL